MAILKIHKHNHRPIAVLTLLAVLFFGAAPVFAGESGLSKSQMIAAAETALGELKNSYANRDAANFFRNVSDDSYLDSGDFKYRTTKKLRRNTSIDLTLTEDNAMQENDKVVLRTHWQKRALRGSTGKLVLTQGKADLVFKISEGRAELLNIRGDSPF